MKSKMTLFLGVALLITISCQALTTPVKEDNPTTTTEPQETETPKPTPTQEQITEKSLAGLIISSPVFGVGASPFMGGQTTGIGIINADGRLVKISEPGIYAGYSQTGEYILYQTFALGEPNNNLFAYHVASGKKVAIVDNLEGVKELISWAKSDPKHFIYSNDYEQLLFEAYGYFEGAEILMADIETGETSILLDNVFQFDINPDQSQIAYTTGEITETSGENIEQGAGCFHANIYDLATTTSIRFDTSNLSEVPVCMGYPTWSPDGKNIAWIAYLQDGTFHPVIFDVGDGTGVLYDEIDVYAGSQFPSGWSISYYPIWIDKSTYWVEGFGINVQTGEISSSPEYPRGAEPYELRPDGKISARLIEGGSVVISDTNGNELTSYSLNDLYDGDLQDIGFDGTEMFSSYIVGWSPSAPPAGIESKLSPEATDVPTFDFSCPNSPRTRVQVGKSARITFTDGTSTFLRSKPEAGDNIIDRLPEGTEFEIIGGPVCYPRPGRSDAYVYWEIRTPSRNNISGWVAEGDLNTYYIEPWP